MQKRIQLAYGLLNTNDWIQILPLYVVEKINLLCSVNQLRYEKINYLEIYYVQAYKKLRSINFSKMSETWYPLSMLQSTKHNIYFYFEVFLCQWCSENWNYLAIWFIERNKTLSLTTQATTFMKSIYNINSCINFACYCRHRIPVSSLVRPFTGTDFRMHVFLMGLLISSASNILPLE